MSETNGYADRVAQGQDEKYRAFFDWYHAFNEAVIREYAQDPDQPELLVRAKVELETVEEYKALKRAEIAVEAVRTELDAVAKDAHAAAAAFGRKQRTLEPMLVWAPAPEDA